MIANERLLSWKSGDRGSHGTGSPGFGVGKIKGSPGFDSIVDSRVVEIAESGKRGREEGETKAAPPMKAVAEVKPSSL